MNILKDKMNQYNIMHNNTNKSDTNSDRYLTIEEKLTIELFLERKEKTKCIIDNMNSKIQNIQLIMQNIEMKKNQFNNDIINIKKQANEEKDKIRLLDNEYENFINTISKKYDLGNDWEFDNDTGKIITNNSVNEKENNE